MRRKTAPDQIYDVDQLPNLEDARDGCLYRVISTEDVWEKYYGEWRIFTQAQMSVERINIGNRLYGTNSVGNDTSYPIYWNDLEMRLVVDHSNDKVWLYLKNSPNNVNFFVKAERCDIGRPITITFSHYSDSNGQKRYVASVPLTSFGLEPWNIILYDYVPVGMGESEERELYVRPLIPGAGLKIQTNSQFYETSITGDGVKTSFDIEHTLETSRIAACTAMDPDTKDIVYPAIFVPDSNIVRISFGLPPANGKNYRIFILGISSAAGYYESIIVGDGIRTEWTITHNQSSVRVASCALYENPQKQLIFPTYQVIDANNIKIKFGLPPAVDKSYRVDIVCF